MPSTLNRTAVRQKLTNFKLRSLFVDDLGWDHGGDDVEISAAGRLYVLTAIAHKRGLVAYQSIADSESSFPDRPTRQMIARALARSVREHVIVYATHNKETQYWQWVRRQPSRPDRPRQHVYHQSQSAEALIQKLEHLVFSLDEEYDITITDVVRRAQAAFDVDHVTRNFYTLFKQQRDAFLAFIQGIEVLSDREWYASIMLNRMMFVYFIQKRGFLDNDIHYLSNRLRRVCHEQGKDRFQTFYRLFLLRLFHEGLSQPVADRNPQLASLLGQVPYLNGGLFEVHDLERDNENIHIPDKAFWKIFSFFDSYHWHLDDRPLRNDNEINPDVLGYIFEKYINQKQLGAYYTKEDITGYISRNTIIPHLLNSALKEYPTAFVATGGVWALLRDNPDRYFPEAIRHGITCSPNAAQDRHEIKELPPEVSAALEDVSKRTNWNSIAPEDYAVPMETWREHLSRRKYYEESRAQLASGKVTSVNSLITFNLDVELLIQDVIAGSDDPELIRAFWTALTQISVLDPTCGSGAFLFSALNILEPIYLSCLEAMQNFVDDIQRFGRRQHSETINSFRQILERVGEHANERYFILKSIVVDNLYGVDIMEEAVEICKLRLFLKLVAQLRTYDQIEPLPDIDFNIRVGNTLVGFASLDEVKRALGDMLKELAIREIEQRAESSDRAFREFREMQTVSDMDGRQLMAAKEKLRSRLYRLRVELDTYLAAEYGVDVDDSEAYNLWRHCHRPFHWFVEFYGIMHGGGFNIVIGNPPYLENRRVPYSVKFFAIKGPIHAMCIERGLALCERGGAFSMIVPLSVVSTKRMKEVQQMLEHDRDCWYSNYSERPGQLFADVDLPLTIFVTMAPESTASTFSTSYLKWYSRNRDQLFSSLRYVKCPRNRDMFWVPKFGNNLELSIYRKFCMVRTRMAHFTGGG